MILDALVEWLEEVRRGLVWLWDGVVDTLKAIWK